MCLPACKDVLFVLERKLSSEHVLHVCVRMCMREKVHNCEGRRNGLTERLRTELSLVPCVFHRSRKAQVMGTIDIAY